LALPTLSELVGSGVLPAGTLVTAADSDEELIGEITEDGQLVAGDFAYG
jgi:hypothetical protein